MLPKNAALKHIALKVNYLDAYETFYHQLGLKTAYCIYVIKPNHSRIRYQVPRHTVFKLDKAYFDKY